MVTHKIDMIQRNKPESNYLSRSLSREKRAEIQEQIRKQSPYFSKDLLERLNKISQLENDWEVAKEKSNSRVSSLNRSVSD